MTGAYRPIQPRERLYQEIVDQVQGLIASGRLKPGDRLPPERELAEQFHVSRTAVREAIKSLAEKGLVTVEVGRGTFVRQLSAENVVESMSFLLGQGVEGAQHLQSARLLLEVPIARLAAEHRSDEQAQALATLLAQMEATDPAAREFIDLDTEFHVALARATGNPVLEVLSRTVVAMLRDERGDTREMDSDMRRAVAGHREIVRCVAARDAAGAERAMAEHLGLVNDMLEARRRAAGGKGVKTGKAPRPSAVVAAAPRPRAATLRRAPDR